MDNSLIFYHFLYIISILLKFLQNLFGEPPFLIKNKYYPNMNSRFYVNHLFGLTFRRLMLKGLKLKTSDIIE